MAKQSIFSKVGSVSRRILGDLFEQKALKFLKKQGFKLLAANFTVRGGEVDLVMLDGQYLVFIEVRYRSDDAWVGSVESIDESKQRRIIRAAEHFRKQFAQYNDLQVRFDAVCFDGNRPINWIRNAFQVQ